MLYFAFVSELVSTVFLNLVADVREGRDWLYQYNPLRSEPSLHSPAVLPLPFGFGYSGCLVVFFASLQRINSRTAKRFFMTFDIQGGHGVA
jgi:hypothetical protein